MKYKNNISFRIVAYTDAAGKFSPDAVRNGNEDNFFVDDDLTDSISYKVRQDEILRLGNLGMLMVIADGMGGANAGEVASQIAINTVKEVFCVKKLKVSVTDTAQSRQKYLEKTIKLADKNIKYEARKDKNREGMGSTIIMAWLYDNELSLCWCGDSRAYIFNEKTGIRLISQDHSYVQELVNKGLLTYDQTFDHPQNNIITRSLGDPTKDAKPESKTVNVGKGDIILLCSDGLSGVLRDRPTVDAMGTPYPEENIEDIIRTNMNSMKSCREALWTAAEKGGWYDNVTVILCQITDGPESKWGLIPDKSSEGTTKSSKARFLRLCISSLFIIAAIISAFFIGKWYDGYIDTKELPTNPTTVEEIDSISLVNISTSNPNETFLSKDDETKTVAKREEKDKPQTESLTDTIRKSTILTPIYREESAESTENKVEGNSVLSGNPPSHNNLNNSSPLQSPKTQH